MTVVTVKLLVEGVTDEAVLKSLLRQANPQLQPAGCDGKKGNRYLWGKIAQFNEAARFFPYVVLADSDGKCPLELIGTNLPNGASENLLLRIAVHEIEAWLLADWKRFAKFLAVDETKMHQRTDELNDPKGEVVRLARRSRKREIREDMVPAQGVANKVGRNYAGRLMEFALNHWRADAAAREASPSLRRAYEAIRKFSPQTTG
jgi:hypothetical protein